MVCKGKPYQISLYLDNMLSEKEKYALEEHLKECARCREILEEYRLLKSVLNRDGFTVSVDIEYSVMDKITRNKRLIVKIGVAASMLFFLGTGVFIGSHMTGGINVAKNSNAKLLEDVKAREKHNKDVYNFNKNIENIKVRYEEVSF